MLTGGLICIGIGRWYYCQNKKKDSVQISFYVTTLFFFILKIIISTKSSKPHDKPFFPFPISNYKNFLFLITMISPTIKLLPPPQPLTSDPVSSKKFNKSLIFPNWNWQTSHLTPFSNQIICKVQQIKGWLNTWKKKTDVFWSPFVCSFFTTIDFNSKRWKKEKKVIRRIGGYWQSCQQEWEEKAIHEVLLGFNLVLEFLAGVFVVQLFRGKENEDDKHCGVDNRRGMIDW